MHIVKVFVTYCSFALHELCTNLYASNNLCYCIQENIRQAKTKTKEVSPILKEDLHFHYSQWN